jgi:hypothetical protein
MINKVAAAIEDRRFRSDLRRALLHQNMLGVANCRKGVAEFLLVPANCLGSFFAARVHQKERRLILELCTKLLNGRSVAIGNWAVCAHKNQHHRLASSGLEWIKGLPSQVGGQTLRAR